MGNLWHSRIRVDKGVENVLVCDAVIQAMGEGRGSFIAGPSIAYTFMSKYLRRCLMVIFSKFSPTSAGLICQRSLDTKLPALGNTQTLKYLIRSPLKSVPAPYNMSSLHQTKV